MDEARTPSQFVILREADGESRFIESKQVDFTNYKFLRSGEMQGLPKHIIVDEWCHESVFDAWCQQMINELFDTRDQSRDSFQ